MRILFALPGLHKYERGAEVALNALATELAAGGDDVTLIGSGDPKPSQPYRFLRARSLQREGFEHFPSLPVFRSETVYEEASFVPGLLRRYRPRDFDITATCSYPFTNWALRRPSFHGSRPPHVFITQNGDWPAQSDKSEYRLFGCEGLVCTNPDYYERNQMHWTCALIPNGIDVNLFRPGPSMREKFGLPQTGLVILMVSALIPSKRVADGIRAVSQLAGAHLVVAGDGPLRDEIRQLAKELLPNRFTRVSVAGHEMPLLYRSADVFLHLSKEESFGNVYIEAMACGLPIVGHDTARLRWIVGDHEFLTDTTDIAAVARQLTEACSSSEGKKKARLARSSDFSWSKVAAKYRTFFEQVIESQKQ
ncbi:MAG: glycosyltransferase family 4 protein [Sphingomonadaceae bacterium]